MKKRSHIFRGLASIFLALMVLFGTVMSVALSWEGRVNELLGISDDTFAKSQNPDDYYYKSDYEDPADLIQGRNCPEYQNGSRRCGGIKRHTSGRWNRSYLIRNA